MKMHMRVFLTLLVKVLYIVVNVLNFVMLDYILNGKYLQYGTKWVDWSKLENYISFDYMGKLVI